MPAFDTWDAIGELFSRRDVRASRAQTEWLVVGSIRASRQQSQ